MRKTKPFTVDAENRDKGKVFLLTEMAAVPAEKWAARAFLALIESGVEIPDELASKGMAGLLSAEALEIVGASLLGGIGKIRWEAVEPLLDEMLTCVRVMPDPLKNPDYSRALNLAADDIEEISTLFKIRVELLKLHMDFPAAAGASTSAAPTASQVAPITRMSRRS